MAGIRLVRCHRSHTDSQIVDRVVAAIATALKVSTLQAPHSSIPTIPLIDPITAWVTVVNSSSLTN